MSDSLRPHGLQFTRPPCPSPTPRADSNSIESVVPSNHLILHHPLLLPSIFPSIRVFSDESVLRIRWLKKWSFSFSISPSNEHPGLISFRMDWLDLLAVPGTLKSLLQHHSSKASLLRCSAFFVVQLSHPYLTTGETLALTRRTFVICLGSSSFWPDVSRPAPADVGTRESQLCLLGVSPQGRPASFDLCLLSLPVASQNNF